jgi:predicted DNA-binding transcriptional regulator AlpA
MRKSPAPRFPFTASDSTSLTDTDSSAVATPHVERFHHRRRKRKKRKTAAAQRSSDSSIVLRDDQFYRDRDLAALFGVHVVTIWSWARQGVISPPVKLGPNISRWSGRIIRQDIERKAEGKIFVA